MAIQIAVDQEQIAEFCRWQHIVKLSFFGSVTTDEFREDSDVDVLVEYDPNHIPDLLKVVGQEEELSGLLRRRGFSGSVIAPLLRRHVRPGPEAGIPGDPPE